MGFYAPAQIVRDAERHGVAVLPPDVNFSDWDSKLEEIAGGAPGRAALHPTHAEMAGDILSRYAVRLGLRQIKGMREEDANLIVTQRDRGYDSVRDLWLRTGLDRGAIERLADGDSFRSIGLDRRDALWAARGESAAKARDRLPLFDIPEHADIRKEPDFALPPMPIGEHIVNDYRYLSLSLKGHPLSFLRPRLAARGIVPNSALRNLPNGARVTVAGLVIIRQRPGTASGVIFKTLEDETDIANAIVWPKIFERFRPVVLGARLVAVTGLVQSEREVIHVVTERIEDLTPMLSALSDDAGDLSSLARADEVAHPSGNDSRDRGIRHPRNVRFFQKDATSSRDDAALAAHDVLPKGRNFH
jgi:DNA polymerase III alpha subunit